MMSNGYDEDYIEAQHEEYIALRNELYNDNYDEGYRSPLMQMREL